jgi:hypothetical protein
MPIYKDYNGNRSLLLEGIEDSERGGNTKGGDELLNSMISGKQG